jgi:hypothetical protein
MTIRGGLAALLGVLLFVPLLLLVVPFLPVLLPVLLGIPVLVIASLARQPRPRIIYVAAQLSSAPLSYTYEQKPGTAKAA